MALRSAPPVCAKTKLANNYDAKNGRYAGGQVQVTSANGTNEFHGSAFVKIDRPGLNTYNSWSVLLADRRSATTPVLTRSTVASQLTSEVEVQYQDVSTGTSPKGISSRLAFTKFPLAPASTMVPPVR
jgi:hypothetical protein